MWFDPIDFDKIPRVKLFCNGVETALIKGDTLFLEKNTGLVNISREGGGKLIFECPKGDDKTMIGGSFVESRGCEEIDLKQFAGLVLCLAKMANEVGLRRLVFKETDRQRFLAFSFFP